MAGLVRDAERCGLVTVERHGTAAAVVVGAQRFAELNELEADLRSAALVLSRFATDSGARTDLDEVISTLGFDRTELEAELDPEPAAGT